MILVSLYPKSLEESYLFHGFYCSECTELCPRIIMGRREFVGPYCNESLNQT